MPSLYRRMSLWFNRRGSDSTSHSKSSTGSANSTPSSSSSSPSVVSAGSAPAACSASLPSSSCVLSRTAPSAYTYDPQSNAWLSSNDNGSVLLHEPADMSFTPHPKQHINAKTTNTVLISQPSIDASSTSAPAASSSATASSAATIVAANPSITMSAPTRHRRLVRPRHFTFSEAHVSRSGQGRLARTTAFF